MPNTILQLSPIAGSQGVNYDERSLKLILTESATDTTVTSNHATFLDVNWSLTVRLADATARRTRSLIQRRVSRKESKRKEKEKENLPHAPPSLPPAEKKDRNRSPIIRYPLSLSSILENEGKQPPPLTPTERRNRREMEKRKRKRPRPNAPHMI